MIIPTLKIIVEKVCTLLYQLLVQRGTNFGRNEDEYDNQDEFDEDYDSDEEDSPSSSSPPRIVRWSIRRLKQSERTSSEEAYNATKIVCDVNINRSNL